jgi:hypothetical protein
MDITRPNRVSQRSSLDTARGTHIDTGQLCSRQCGDMHHWHGMHDFLPSPRIPNGNLSGSTTQGE